MISPDFVCSLSNLTPTAPLAGTLGGLPGGGSRDEGVITGGTETQEQLGVSSTSQHLPQQQQQQLQTQLISSMNNGPNLHRQPSQNALEGGALPTHQKQQHQQQTLLQQQSQSTASGIIAINL